ncbi:MAG: hypothetical protein ACXAE3_04695 [Candidatus Kariarchaeaceae archaeon]
MELTTEQLVNFHRLTRMGLSMSFVVIVIMLFHVLIDLFFHAG